MNTPTLGSIQFRIRDTNFCTARIGRADIEVANRAVDLFLSKAKITLPIRTLGRDNSVIPGVTFQSFPTLIKKVREFARPHFRVWNLLCLRSNQADFCPCTQLRIISFDVSILSIFYRQMFLNRMSQPLGAIDIFSTACHPSQTVHQPLSLLQGK